MTIVPTRLRSGQTGCDGFIVVAVLWILGALAILASIYSVYVINTATGFRAYEDGYRAQELASAAIELTAYQLSSVQPRPTHGQFNFRAGQANVAVEFQTEAARIDLNAAPKELIAGLFIALGIEPDQAQIYAGRIVGWRTPVRKGEDTEAPAYRAAGLGYAPRHAPFPHVDELSLVVGVPAPLVDRVLPFMTIYSGRAQVNILDAAPEVIAALPGLSPERLNAVLAQRRLAPGDGQRLLALLGPAQAHATLEGSQASRVSVRITFEGGRQVNSEIVILVFDQGPEPYSVLSWRDDSDYPRADDQLRTAVR